MNASLSFYNNSKTSYSLVKPHDQFIGLLIVVDVVLLGLMFTIEYTERKKRKKKNITIIIYALQQSLVTTRIPKG